jgi:hypothetical protein
MNAIIVGRKWAQNSLQRMNDSSPSRELSRRQFAVFARSAFEHKEPRLALQGALTESVVSSISLAAMQRMSPVKVSRANIEVERMKHGVAAAMVRVLIM